MDTHLRSFPHDGGELLRGVGRRFFRLHAKGEAELFLLAQVARPLQAVHNEVEAWLPPHFGLVHFQPSLDFRRQLRNQVRQLATASSLDHVRQLIGQVGQQVGVGRIYRGEIQHVELPLFPPIRRVLHGQAEQCCHHHPHCHFVIPSHDEQITGTLATEVSCGGRLDGHGLAQPGGNAAAQIRPTGRGQKLVEGLGVLDERGRVALEDDLGLGRTVAPLFREGANALQVALSLVVGQPGHLEGVVALHQTVGVVVDGLTRPGEEPGCGVVVSQDEAGVCLAALERDAHGHLVDGTAGQGVTPGQGLGAQEDVHAKRAALAHQAVQDLRHLRGYRVVLGEELLELVHDEQDARHALAGFVPVVSDVVHARSAEEVAPALQFRVQPLEHAEAELPLALDGHDTSVGQRIGGIDLELHALLEIHQVEFHFIGAVGEGQVGDEHVQEGGFARARAAHDQRVLRGAFAQVQVLEPPRARGPQGHANPLTAVPCPPLLGWGRDALEGDFHLARLFGGLAHRVEDAVEEFRLGRGVQFQGAVAEVLVLPDEVLTVP